MSRILWRTFLWDTNADNKSLSLDTVCRVLTGGSCCCCCYWERERLSQVIECEISIILLLQ